MAENGSGDIPSIILLGCRAQRAPDGSVDLVFDAVGGGAIAFGITTEGLRELRRAIGDADEFLDRQRLK